MVIALKIHIKLSTEIYKILLNYFITAISIRIIEGRSCYLFDQEEHKNILCHGWNYSQRCPFVNKLFIFCALKLSTLLTKLMFVFLKREIVHIHNLYLHQGDNNVMWKNYDGKYLAIFHQVFIKVLVYYSSKLFPSSCFPLDLWMYSYKNVTSCPTQLQCPILKNVYKN